MTFNLLLSLYYCEVTSLDVPAVLLSFPPSVMIYTFLFPSFSPLQEGDSLGAMEKLCRQLTYHLSPHSQWRRQGIVKRKPQAW